MFLYRILTPEDCISSSQQQSRTRLCRVSSCRGAGRGQVRHRPAAVLDVRHTAAGVRWRVQSRTAAAAAGTSSTVRLLLSAHRQQPKLVQIRFHLTASSALSIARPPAESDIQGGPEKK